MKEVLVKVSGIFRGAFLIVVIVYSCLVRDCIVSLASLATAQMPAKYMNAKNKPRGVANRLAGLDWVRANAKDGVLYFADDDNTYDIRIFEQVRPTLFKCQDNRELLKIL
ncbi:Galactosylgalactosylxylosylprotein 3-beta-glucuronosyltransferase P [Portunus trituberculatus]|uniref:Galactosylgalactosylxylosylprotein 3-beta-glucuronosyltransferase n=1 Tax=Portunus trituberculatus TaxID=210409 RepID=A0A5B7IF59_PORTR|nr:Galactosylgalactosylxylosylprotein 3-beta-glucuronosyltransferase P [Portunus trituberculatus]